jgi:hypothetical protein
LNFYKTDPVEKSGLRPTGRPLVRLVQISQMLDPIAYRRIGRKIYHLHCQFVSGNDRRYTYDYFMLLCGPLSTERQVRLPRGACLEIGEDGALLDGTQLQQEEPTRERPKTAAAASMR